MSSPDSIDRLLNPAQTPSLPPNRTFNSAAVGYMIIGGGFALLSATLLTLVATGVIKTYDKSFMNASSYKTMLIVMDSLVIAGGGVIFGTGLYMYKAHNLTHKTQTACLANEVDLKRVD